MQQDMYNVITIGINLNWKKKLKIRLDGELFSLLYVPDGTQREKKTEQAREKENKRER